MDAADRAHDTESGQAGAAGPVSRQFAGGRDWSIGEFVCTAGPDDRPFEERHDCVSIAAVVAGSFNYVSDSGRALLHPGALLLGNHGACYQCGHDHSVGDRCIAVQFSPDYFAEIAATAAGSSKFRFPLAMLSARRDLLPHASMLEATGKGLDLIHIEEKLTRFMTAAICALSGASPLKIRVSPQDERRISRALHHIEKHADAALDLDRLASVAAMSKFHFLRVFRRTTGMTPYQFVLGIRLRRTAIRLLTSPDAVSKIAFESGFGDLSTFNATFRTRFGMSPLSYRQKGALP